jgi:hypothetical protein
MGGTCNTHGYMSNAMFVEHLKVRDHFLGINVDERIKIEKWVLRKQVLKVWTGFIWFKFWPSFGL